MAPKMTTKMTTNWKKTSLAVALTAVAFTCASLPAGFAQTKAKLSIADARTAALAVENGKVKSEEVEKEKGKQIYSFDIEMPNGLHEVNIDAVTGKVIEDSIESAEDEAKEAAKEAAEDKAAKAKKKKAKQSPDSHPQQNWLRNYPNPQRGSVA